MKMKVSLPLILSSTLLLLLALSVSVVESSNELNITRGSSLSTNSPKMSYWLSPSGNLAFGFYPLCPDSVSCRFIVGIWLIKSTEKTLVWTSNRNDPPIQHPSSILFNNDGKLVLETSDGREKPLLHDMWEPASYAVMHDNGNFIMYSSNSTIIWETFDYPTDTILGGQVLKSDQSLISRLSEFDPSFGRFELRIQRYLWANNYAICDRNLAYVFSRSYVDCGWDSKVVPLIMNLDSKTGRLYIVDWEKNVVLNTITKGESQTQKQQHGRSNTSTSRVLYRATMDEDGHFRVYKEIIGTESETLVLWPSRGTKLSWSLVRASITLGISFMFSVLLYI